MDKYVNATTFLLQLVAMGLDRADAVQVTGLCFDIDELTVETLLEK